MTTYCVTKMITTRCSPMPGLFCVIMIAARTAVSRRGRFLVRPFVRLHTLEHDILLCMAFKTDCTYEILRCKSTIEQY